MFFLALAFALPSAALVYKFSSLRSENSVLTFSLPHAEIIAILSGIAMANIVYYVESPSTYVSFMQIVFGLKIVKLLPFFAIWLLGTAALAKKSSRVMFVWNWVLRGVAICFAWSFIVALWSPCSGLYRQKCLLPHILQPGYSNKDMRSKGVIIFEPAANEAQDTTVELNKKDTLVILKAKGDRWINWHTDDNLSILTEVIRNNGWHQVFFRLRFGKELARVRVHMSSTSDEASDWQDQFNRPQKSLLDIATPAKVESQGDTAKPEVPEVKEERYADRYPAGALSSAPNIPTLSISPKGPIDLHSGKGCKDNFVEFTADQPAYWGSSNSSVLQYSSAMGTTRMFMAFDGTAGSVQVTATLGWSGPSASAVVHIDNTPCK